jgi:hypothetical protein
MTEQHPWTTLPLIDNDTVSKLSALINAKEITPKGLYTYFHLGNVYLLAEQLRYIHQDCAELYSDYKSWCVYDHALCCRVVDRWNLTPRQGAEGYYHCTEDYIKTDSEPPYEWKPVNQQLEESWFL